MLVCFEMMAADLDLVARVRGIFLEVGSSAGFWVVLACQTVMSAGEEIIFHFSINLVHLQ